MALIHIFILNLNFTSFNWGINSCCVIFVVFLGKMSNKKGNGEDEEKLDAKNHCVPCDKIFLENFINMLINKIEGITEVLVVSWVNIIEN